MAFSGHIVGLLKAYMNDLVEQAKQEQSTNVSFGFSSVSYRPDQAISDLLAILDDRLESEGLQVGLPQEFLHQMWALCSETRTEIEQRVWLETRAGDQVASKATIRELTYRAVVAALEQRERA
ncbi:MAG TPA: hypothetical protein VFS39_11270 [Nitrospira sp.]|nr:hypothetical protein [Nitrospira sp.]